ncbi:MAG: twin-arginine translocation signal domain-containing protein [Verrucomicrobia bacterium]|nr:twin-arginine translocation signal domain-containing protein [Verrucomicrobiota bacterium]
MKTRTVACSHPTRREFLKTSAAAAATTLAPSLFTETALGAERPATQKTIGIQVGSISFVDEGADRVLDILQERGAVDTVYLTTFTYGRGLAGRQIPGQPFPDHGVQESDEKFFRGGNFASPHPEFYKNTVLKQTRAPDHGDLDIVATVLPAAKKRGLKLFCSIEDVFRSDVPGAKDVAEVDLQGRKAGTLCLFHPDVRAFWTGLAEDLCRSYDIDGILFFNERNGPLLNALGASHSQSIASSRTTCFCEHHQKAARERGIDFQRAYEGFRKLDRFVQAALKGERPGDGYFVEFWRLLVENPEIILWDRLFDEGKHQVLAEVNRTVKGVRPNLRVGFHIEHVNSFNPIFRATRSYEDLAAKADFLKVVVYNNCGRERYANFIRNVGSTVFRDVPRELLLQFNNHLLNYGSEAGLSELATAGLSPDYVARETKRAIEGVQGKCRILPGIDIGIPTGKSSRKASPEDTYAAVAAALKAGADGLILSRKYSEMRLANLAAAGKAVREFKA